jgi:hypothetical protein
LRKYKACTRRRLATGNRAKFKDSCEALGPQDRPARNEEEDVHA